MRAGQGKGIVRGVVLAMLGATVAMARAEEPKGEAWVGKRVVQRAEAFSVEAEGKAVNGGKTRIETYRVEKVDGPRLWLRASGLEGWANADEVVPVEGAVAHFNGFIREHPDDPFGYTMRATIRHKIDHDLEAAMVDYNEAVRVAPAASHVYNNRANASMTKGDYNRAIADYGEAIRLVPGSAIAWTNRGTAWAAKRHYPRAIDDHDRAIAIDPKYTMAYLNRASALRSVKEFDRAIADCNQAILLDPHYAFAFLGRATGHAGKEDFKRAFDDYDEAIKVDPNSAPSYNIRGLAYYARKNYDRAIADYDRAIAIDPKFAFAYTNRGLARRVQGDRDRALIDLDAAIRLAPKASLAYNIRGIIHQDSGDYDRALAEFDAAIRVDPKSSLPRRNRAVVGLIRGDAKGLDDARAAIDCDGWWSESSIYSVLIGHFAARRAHRESEARTILDDAFRRCDESAWPYPIVKFLRGEIDEKALQTLAIDGDKRTEVHGYLGLNDLLNGRTGAARDHFGWVKEHGTKTFMEHAIAIAELRRLNAPVKP